MDSKKMTVLLAVSILFSAVTLGYVVISDSTKTISTAAPSVGAPAEDTITVYGQGIVYINPDIAYITFGYENTDTNPKKAQDDNALQMEKLIAAVKASGIVDTDIQTSQYNVYQEYDYTGNTKTIKGYRVTNTIQVKVRDVAKAGDTIEAAYNAGANLFNGIAFDIIDRQETYLNALDIALGRAEEKALKLASASGRRIAGVVSITESPSSSSGYTPYSNFVYSSALAMADSSGAISSGELQITAVVSVTYNLN